LDTQTNKKVAIKIFDNLDETLDEIEEDYAVISTHWIHPNIPYFCGLFLQKGKPKTLKNNNKVRFWRRKK
jgi:hypothetical protein